MRQQTISPAQDVTVADIITMPRRDVRLKLCCVFVISGNPSNDHQVVLEVAGQDGHSIAKYYSAIISAGDTGNIGWSAVGIQTVSQQGTNDLQSLGIPEDFIIETGWVVTVTTTDSSAGSVIGPASWTIDDDVKNVR